MKVALLAAIRVPFAFMSAVPTVVIMRDHGPVEINASDYDEDRDGEIFTGNEKWNADGTLRVTNRPAVATDEPNKPTDEPNASGASAIGSLGVVNRKKKGKDHFIVIDTGNGQDVIIDGIDPKGYPTNEAAWKAISDIQLAAQSSADGAGAV